MTFYINFSALLSFILTTIFYVEIKIYNYIILNEFIALTVDVKI